MSPDPDIARIRVLIVDDDENLQRLLALVFRRQGWKVLTASSGEAGILQAKSHRPHLVVLDVSLPDIDGLQVLQRIRAELPDTLVLFLTAHSSVSERISGIAAGGDDYMSKPFSTEEVMVRLRGLSRRSRMIWQADPLPVLIGDLTLDENSHAAARAGEHIRLTPTEFALLRYLADNVNRVVSKHQILDRVWEYDYGRESKIVEMYISYLRRKIDAGRPRMIHTIRRVGYMLRAPSDIEHGDGHLGRS
ncbi:response regulator transcription factor [Plantibacter sp. VKM Ac-2885]|uniref:response regulator transcription factor n=1 Tax=Plantibacter sp. VKM Ac-2885 TaxID=2783828 RepID=UPI00188D67D1|nr:response regulator transcription factor [Plantibacter sp. VKM Ac-2885]MBF4514127.1 response regulator transcription factor [Plantibacter sp. VKM Ac-2885]